MIMEINFKNKNELTFIGIGILMVITVILMMIWAISFIAGNIGIAIEKQGNGPRPIIQFQLDRAEAILTK